MTSGLAAAITADTSLAAIGVSATAVSTVVNIKSNSQNATTYTSSLSGGATATITLAKTISAQLSAYNNVNELTSIAAGGPVRFQASTNKALTTASVNNNPATLTTTKNFVRDESLSSGASAASIAATDGANNTKTNTYQVNVNPVSTQNLTYDANGNMTNDGTNTYKWDAENRLIEIVYPGSGNKSEFVYDGRGHNTKITETISGTVSTVRQFISIGSRRREERDGSSAVVSRYFGNGETAAASFLYFAKDHLYSIRSSADQTGTIQSSTLYNSYGKRTSSGSIAPDFGYAQTFFHNRSGLSLTKFRAYHPTIGRWLSRDPIGEIITANLYSYAGADPISFRDASGLMMGGGNNGHKPPQSNNQPNDAAGGGGGGPPPPDPNKEPDDNDDEEKDEEYWKCIERANKAYDKITEDIMKRPDNQDPRFCKSPAFRQKEYLKWLKWLSDEYVDCFEALKKRNKKRKEMETEIQRRVRELFEHLDRTYGTDWKK